MTYTYIPRGVCPHSMEIDLENGVIRDLRICGGCEGNLQGIMRLVRGAKAEDVAQSLAGVRCGGKQTSCPDQLAAALTEALAAAGRDEQTGEDEQTDDQ